MYEYVLRIPVKKDTDCLVKFMEPDDQTPTTLNQSAPCNDYLDVPDKNGPKCYNEWFVNNMSDTLYSLYYYSNDSTLPKEGRYSLTLNNGTEVNFVKDRCTNIKMNFMLCFQKASHSTS